jgi:hypothetical protein
MMFEILLNGLAIIGGITVLFVLLELPNVIAFLRFMFKGDG